MISTSWSMDDHLVPLLSEMVGQPGTDEATTAGDEGAHDGSPYWLGAGRFIPEWPDRRAAER